MSADVPMKMNQPHFRTLSTVFLAAAAGERTGLLLHYQHNKIALETYEHSSTVHYGTHNSRATPHLQTSQWRRLQHLLQQFLVHQQQA